MGDSDPPTIPWPQATGETHPYMPGQRLKRPELDLKRYDLKRPDFEGIWLKIEA